MSDGVDAGFRTDHAVFADSDRCGVEENAVEVSEEVLSEEDIISVVAMERGFYHDFLPALAEELFEYCISQLRLILRGTVILLRQGTRVAFIPHKLGISRTEGKTRGHFFTLCHGVLL